MSSVSGLLKIGEANATIKDIARRQRGRALSYYALLFGLGIAGGVIGFFLLPPTRFISDLGDARIDGAAGGWVLGIVFYQLIARRLTLARFRKRMADNGFSPELPLRMNLTQEALDYEFGAIHSIAQWPAVTELFSSHGYWIFLAQASAFFAPRRFFADADVEKAFIRDALSRMSDAARKNSPDAATFVS